MNEPDQITNLFFNAVMNNDVPAVNEILNEGLDPNVTIDSDAITPLHVAAQSDALDVIPLLVSAGADLFAQSEPDGYLPIDIASMHKHHHIVQLLAIYMQDDGQYTVH